MATDKFSFWIGYRDALRKLEPSDGYRLVMAMCDYAFDGIEPDFEPMTPLDYTWTPIRDQVAESVRINRASSEGGKKSGETRRRKSKKGTSEPPSEPPSERIEGTKGNRSDLDVPSGTSAGFASAPSGAGSPADDDDEAFRKSFMMSQAMVGRPIGGGR